MNIYLNLWLTPVAAGSVYQLGLNKAAFLSSHITAAVSMDRFIMIFTFFNIFPCAELTAMLMRVTCIERDL